MSTHSSREKVNGIRRDAGAPTKNRDHAFQHYSFLLRVLRQPLESRPTWRL